MVIRIVNSAYGTRTLPGPFGPGFYPWPPLLGWAEPCGITYDPLDNNRFQRTELTRPDELVLAGTAQDETEVGEGITTADRLKTSIDTLTSFGGMQIRSTLEEMTIRVIGYSIQRHPWLR